MTVRVDVSPQVIAWARERSRVDRSDLIRKFRRLPLWELGEATPTLRQLEEFARTTHTPIGFLLLSEPPEETLPIADYRTVQDATVTRPSADLLDTIFQCQQRQEWYRSFAQLNRDDPVAFICSLTTATPAIEAATLMRETLRFDVTQRGTTFTESLSRLAHASEERGVLVMVNGVVGNNTHRKLDPKEFRGFVLVDRLAPLVFVNGADTKSAQIFTLAHELAHLWLGETGLDDIDLTANSTIHIERWCNQVAAEFLVPISAIQADFERTHDLTPEAMRLARQFKVSTLVIIRRIFDAGYLDWDSYRSAYRNELERVLALVAEGAGGGGNFYNTQPSRVSRRFASAVIGSTLEGHTLYTEAFEMLGLRKLSTFEELAGRLGVG